jgi:hypothetical protein
MFRSGKLGLDLTASYSHGAQEIPATVTAEILGPFTDVSLALTWAKEARFNRTCFEGLSHDPTSYSLKQDEFADNRGLRGSLGGRSLRSRTMRARVRDLLRPGICGSIGDARVQQMGETLGCPRCGGEARSLIAPGYWRCESLVAWDQPDRRGGTIPERVTGTCGYAYQEGRPGMGGVPACSCGTDSIGTCVHCGQRVCGIHSKLFHSARVCDACMPAAQQRREREEAEKAAAHAARLATLPPMGARQFAAHCREWADFAGGREGLERMCAIGGGQAPDDGRYVLRPMQGKVIAQALAELEVPTYTDEIRKWYSSKWQPHEDLGWQIW